MTQPTDRALYHPTRAIRREVRLPTPASLVGAPLDAGLKSPTAQGLAEDLTIVAFISHQGMGAGPRTPPATRHPHRLQRRLCQLNLRRLSAVHQCTYWHALPVGHQYHLAAFAPFGEPDGFVLFSPAQRCRPETPETMPADPARPASPERCARGVPKRPLLLLPQPPLAGHWAFIPTGHVLPSAPRAPDRQDSLQRPPVVGARASSAVVRGQ